jgi:hypothetical protein
MKSTIDTHTGKKFEYNTTAYVKIERKLVRTVAKETPLNFVVLHPKRLSAEKLESLNPGKGITFGAPATKEEVAEPAA